MLSLEQSEQFEIYYRMLVEWNERMNLTGITEREAVYEKHFYDSLTVMMRAPQGVNNIHTMADIGSGAGFPSVPIAIMLPELRVTIVDSLNKRIQFLQALTDALGLKHVKGVHGRAEDVARRTEHRDRYDLVSARAVARLSVLNELCLPFVRPQGHFAAMKGADPRLELEEAGNSLKKLKGTVRKVDQLELPQERSERHIVWIHKTDATPPAYPRKAGTPAKTPL
ncbi:16S rRNA (guanine(527)-N(7))-methyltransferase RsmG [Paenibacillus sp. IB182496]|uniref:Ribosomal RNA small subunit methyltransferase G n=1 Tax=Paenibacillus sabuli TaxID=2772509 RepID=A0A927BX80_9BACL|nr:16S rRNA (guanine(527)-N(7))-methyltransferase RsmG [Paenibacillus sabuli]MBD2848017.1 16S rRNA (guanine(527)-N(7))-methyltransferase RsmG [Paenibacillus sabuli]